MVGVGVADGLTVGEAVRVRVFVTAIVFSPDGSQLITASQDGTVRLWSAADGKLLNVLYGHMGSLWDLALSPDGTLLAAGGDYGSIRVWRLEDGASLNLLTIPVGEWISSVAFSPDGKLLASSSFDQTVWLWGIP